MGKVKFKSDEIFEQFQAICNFCIEKHIRIYLEELDCHITEMEKLYNADDDEDFFIDENTILKIDLPSPAKEYSIGMYDFHDMMQQTMKGKIEENTRFISRNLGLFHVKGLPFLKESRRLNTIPSVAQKWNNIEIIVEIVGGLTCYGLSLILSQSYNKYWVPVLSEDTFIQIISRDEMDSQTFREIAEAYIFALHRSYSLDIHLSVRPTHHKY